jgi:hypothetical protein
MAERKIPVIYQQKRKLVNIDFSSFNAVASAIRRRLQITDEIELFGKRKENEAFFDIEDDEDLEGLDGAEEPVLLVKSGSQRGTASQPPHQHCAPGYEPLRQGFQLEKENDEMDCRYSAHGTAGYSPTTVPPAMPVSDQAFENPPDYEESIGPAAMHGARSTEQRPTRNQTTRSEVRKQCQKVF